MTPRILDSALSGLTTALDPAAMSPKLGELLASDTGTGASLWRVVGVELLKHKPGRRCSLAYTVDGPAGRQQVFAKTFESDRGVTILGDMTSFHQAMAKESLIVPRPLGYFPEIKMLVTEFIEGRSLASPLYDGDSKDPARRMALAVATLHSSGVVCARRWSPHKEIRHTAEWVGASGGRDSDATARSRELLQPLALVAREMPSALDRPIHRDFHPEQVQDAQGKTVLLHLDDTRAGDPAVDVANFLVHLQMRSMQFPETAPRCEFARGVFLDEYLTRQPCNESQIPLRSRIRFYQATSLLRLSGVYGARERWATRLPPMLLAACETVLGEVVS